MDWQGFTSAGVPLFACSAGVRRAAAPDAADGLTKVVAEEARRRNQYDQRHPEGGTQNQQDRVRMTHCQSPRKCPMKMVGTVYLRWACFERTIGTGRFSCTSEQVARVRGSSPDNRQEPRTLESMAALRIHSPPSHSGFIRGGDFISPRSHGQRSGRVAPRKDCGGFTWLWRI